MFIAEDWDFCAFCGFSRLRELCPVLLTPVHDQRAMPFPQNSAKRSLWFSPVLGEGPVVKRAANVKSPNMSGVRGPAAGARAPGGVSCVRRPKGGPQITRILRMGRAPDFFQSPRLPHECGVPAGFGTSHSCGSEECCRAPLRKAEIPICLTANLIPVLVQTVLNNASCLT
jgi:hypothetical protein